MTTSTKQALKHALMVFFYNGVSAIIPIALMYVENDPKWLFLAPLINGAWAFVRKKAIEKNL